ncbi:MAG TPA: hypothetical protein VHM25_15675 [Polyangiaceae bacterium]|nr:hypothetical protein [Polyangiaceae bacterium]
MGIFPARQKQWLAERHEAGLLQRELVRPGIREQGGYGRFADVDPVEFDLDVGLRDVERKMGAGGVELVQLGLRGSQSRPRKRAAVRSHGFRVSSKGVRGPTERAHGIGDCLGRAQ